MILSHCESARQHANAQKTRKKPIKAKRISFRDKAGGIIAKRVEDLLEHDAICFSLFSSLI